jgi:hypothetical protein
VWDRVRTALRDALHRYGLDDVAVDRDPQPSRRTAGGKFRTVYADLARAPRPGH